MEVNVDVRMSYKQKSRTEQFIEYPIIIRI